ncbi:MAG: sulfatase family protein [Opitutales bacterium]
MRILYIDIDSLRPDHLGCYGYHRTTSPHIDALAEDSVRFNQVYASDAPCLPSRTAFYTGQFGIRSGVVGHGGTAADPRIDGISRGFSDVIQRESLPMVLQRAGFHTAQISPFGQRHAARQFFAGFLEIHNTGGGGSESAEAVTPAVMRWLEANAARDDWYLHVNYWDPHTPYRVPMDEGEPFAEEPLPAWLTQEVLDRHVAMTGPHKPLEFQMYDDHEDPRFPRQPGSFRDLEGLRRCIDGYDTGVLYADKHVGQVIQYLRDRGLYEDTAIILSADHGENLGELGIYGEHGTADGITCRVPMIIKWPGVKGGRTDDGLHYQLDLAPTLAALLDQPPSPSWDGQSFARALTDGEEQGREDLVISQCAHVCQRSVRFGPWLYMRTYHDGYHGFPREMLYHLEEDPHEQHDLAADKPEVCREGAARLLTWQDTALARSTSDTDPLWTVIREGGPFHARGRLARYLPHLEKTNRRAAADRLRNRYPEETAPAPRWEAPPPHRLPS